MSNSIAILESIIKQIFSKTLLCDKVRKIILFKSEGLINAVFDVDC